MFNDMWYVTLNDIFNNHIILLPRYVTSAQQIACVQQIESDRLTSHQT